ncbi:DUF262 domain-containing protein [Cupriavidus basilensis]
MSLDEEISVARKEIISDGYDMSVGEVMNLYRDEELIVNPTYQRLFRWDESQKTRFIESLLLGIPIPPIFVMQDEGGVWELIDGLQRLSTVLEFAGLLRNNNGGGIEPSVLGGTTFLPSLAGKRWEPSDEGANDGIGKAQQLQIKRARLRVEILKKESDPKAKYELFQRLNTGGASLTPQEVRNCVAVMIDPGFHAWLVERSQDANFVITTCQTELALEQQMGVELALRFLAFRSVPYEQGLDVHEYLDDALERIATDAAYPRVDEQNVFSLTFEWLNAALGDGAFKKWNQNNSTFGGKFLMSAFEVIAVGVSKNIEQLAAMDAQARKDFILERTKALWGDANFLANSGAGVRGTTRLANLLPMGEAFFNQ